MALGIIGLASVAMVIVWLLVHHTSPLVRRWRPSSFARRTAGPLSVLDSGPPSSGSGEVVVLMHGVGATGEYFGDLYDGLSRRRRVVIVDVLGFGESVDEHRTDFGLDAHVDALDHALRALGLDTADVVLAAHSMSTAVALSWARRHPDRARHVYLWGPPAYPDKSASDAVGKQYGLMGRLFVSDTTWAKRLCRFNCANRTLSGAMMAAVEPRWPTAVSSRASRHTWDAYSGSLRSLIFDFDWSTVLPAQVPVTIFHGTDDPIGDRQYLGRIAGSAKIHDVPGADHHIALQRPDLLFDAVAS